MTALSPSQGLTVTPGNFGVRLQDRVAAVVMVEVRPSDVRISEVNTGPDGLRVPVLQVVLSAETWEHIAPMVERTLNGQLAGFGCPTGTFSGVRITLLAGSNVGKELLVLAWAVEDAAPAEFGRILTRWATMHMAERWWLYNRARVCGRGHGWRVALRHALAAA